MMKILTCPAGWYRPSRTILASAWMLFSCTAVLADVVNVNVSPQNTAVNGQLRVNLTLPTGGGSTPIAAVPGSRIGTLQLGSARFRANWRIVCAMTGDTASSPQGRFILDGAVVATTGPLTEPTCIPPGSVTAENVIIPEAVMRAVETRVRAIPVRAFLGKNAITSAFSVYYRRDFRDTTGPVRTDAVNIVFRIRVGGGVVDPAPETAAPTADPATPDTAPAPAQTFQLTRVDLSFDDGNRLGIHDRGETRRVVAVLNYLGTGFLRATWEIAPVSAGGSAFFRPLPMSTDIAARGMAAAFDQRPTRTLVREYLGQFQRVNLLSPVLPDQPGYYLVRLNIDSPEALFALPVLEFSVGGAGVASAPEPEPVSMELSLANSDGGLSAATRLHWRPVGLTRAYRYEIYADDAMSGGMIAGAVLPASSLEAPLSPLVIDRLEPGREYHLRVVAIDDAGRVHGLSELIGARLTRDPAAEN